MTYTNNIDWENDHYKFCAVSVSTNGEKRVTRINEIIVQKKPVKVSNKGVRVKTLIGLRNLLDLVN